MKCSALFLLSLCASCGGGAFSAAGAGDAGNPDMPPDASGYQDAHPVMTSSPGDDAGDALELADAQGDELRDAVAIAITDAAADAELEAAAVDAGAEAGHDASGSADAPSVAPPADGSADAGPLCCVGPVGSVPAAVATCESVHVCGAGDPCYAPGAGVGVYRACGA